MLVSGVTALTNSSDGVNIINTASSTTSAVTLSGLSTLNYNGSTALSINTNGAVTTGGLLAVSNGSGVNLFNATGPGTSPVTLSGINVFDKNNGNGLTINSYGKVITSALTATNNSSTGVNISTQAAITIGGMNAVDNAGSYGANIDNSGAGSSQPVTLSGINIFNNNISTGLNVSSKGVVLVSGITALTNGGNGVNIVNSTSSTTSAVTLSGLSTFNYNGSTALSINTNGAVTTGGLLAVSNGSGVNLYNATGPGTSPVTLSGINVFDKNNGNGLTINSYGKVVTTALKSTSNTGYGATIDNSGSTSNVPITLSGASTFNYNGLSGLNLNSKGAVSTSGLTILSNAGTGANIATNSSTSHTVSLNGVNTFKGNSTGLSINSNGTVIVNSLNSSNNLSTGAVINNTSSIITSPVTLNGLTTINYNGSTGLVLNSKGTILTNGLNVLSNSSSGAIIDNSGSLSSSPVTLKGINTFSNNNGTGLNLNSKGTLITFGLSASNNTSVGTIINNSGSSTVAPVTLMGLSTFNFNGSTGLILTSKNAVLTNGLSVLNNGNSGAIIDNSSSTSSATVTLKGIDTFSNNIGTGLNLNSNGIVLTNGLSASNNSSVGAIINNSGASTIAPVTLKSINVFNNNGSSGLVITSKNTITTNNLTANDNGSIGVSLANNLLGATGGINVLGNNVMFNNGANGLNLLSLGAVTVTDVSGKFNSSDGFFVDTPGNITVTCGSFIGNGTGLGPTGYGWETGLTVLTIKLIGVTTVGNYTGDYHLGAGVPTFIPKSCVLP